MLKIWKHFHNHLPPNVQAVMQNVEAIICFMAENNNPVQ